MAVDFFGNQDRAKQNSAWLITLFVVALFLMIPTVYFLIWFVLAQVSLYTPHGYGLLGHILDPHFGQTFWHPKIFGCVGIGVVAVVLAGTVQRLNELAAGGSAVANILGATPVPMNTANPSLRKLVNVVEEMSIASSVAVPRIYVLENEPGINACAAGNSIEDTAIIVTSGALENLTRDELQGVIAHEYSHILNGDMNINMQLLGLVFGLTCLAECGRWLFDSSFRRRLSNSAYAVEYRLRSSFNSGAMLFAALGGVLYSVGWVGVLFGNLVKAAVSRERECLADAAAVQFTRNPEALVGALKKVALHGSNVESSGARQANHFFLCQAERFSGLFDTHPPLIERIKTLDPTFDPESLNTPAAFASRNSAEYPNTLAPGSPGPAAITNADRSATHGTTVQPMPSPQQTGNSSAPPLSSTAPASSATTNSAPPASLSGALLRPKGESDRTDQTALDSAIILKSGLPEPLLRASRELVGGCAIVLSMLVSREGPVQESQLSALMRNCNKFVYDEMTRLSSLIQALPTECKLPLVSMSMPALRELAPDQYAQFRKCMDMLIKADDRVDFFEYAIQKIVARNLDPVFNKAPAKATPKITNLISLRIEISIVLSALAYLDEKNPTKAFVMGASKVTQLQGQLLLMSKPESGLTFVDDALSRLSGATKPIKDILLDAARATVLADGKVTQQELEMVRALAESLGCAVPLLICGPSQMEDTHTK